MRVLLCEDDDLTANDILVGLNVQGVSIEWVNTVAAARAQLQARHFDVAILDLGLASADGLKFLRQVRQSGIQLPVLILVARDKLEDSVAGLKAGADDYLLKPLDHDELHLRLNALVHRFAGRSANPIEHGSLSYDSRTRETRLAGQVVELTRREQSLLYALLQSRGGVLSGEQIKDSIYGFGDLVANNAVNVHVLYLRRKLGGRIVETVRGEGYRLGPSVFVGVAPDPNQ